MIDFDLVARIGREIPGERPVSVQAANVIQPYAFFSVDPIEGLTADASNFRILIGSKQLLEPVRAGVRIVVHESDDVTRNFR